MNKVICRESMPWEELQRDLEQVPVPEIEFKYMYMYVDLLCVRSKYELR